jgi:FMN phosphatase YigB (HAD superfamily)
MSPDRRAVVFDLDDTLYPYRRFLASGFAVIAETLSATFGCDRLATLRTLLRASRGRARGHEIQVCLAALQLPPGLAPELVARLISHTPWLRLPRSSENVLIALRRAGWRIGIITNGPAAAQSRKVAALGLANYVDAVVYASEHGTGAGKPESHAFVAMSTRLDVAPDRCVMVGDNEDCDIAGALGAGFHAIRCTAWARHPVAEVTRANGTIAHLADVPRIAASLLEEVSHRHVA